MTSILQRRQDHVNSLVVDNRLCHARTGKVPAYSASTAENYVFALWKIGVTLGPWQVQSKAVEKAAGRVAYAAATAEPELMTPKAWLLPSRWLRIEIATAMAKHYNGALVNGRPLSPWLPYGEPSPIWDLAQLPTRDTPRVATAWRCDICGRLLQRHLEVGDSWWEDEDGLRECRGTVPDYKGDYEIGEAHTVDGRAESRSVYNRGVIYRQMDTAYPLQVVDLPALAATVTGRERKKFRKALLREQKAAGLL